MRTYYSKTRSAPIVAPEESDGPLLIVAHHGSPWPVGIAYPAGVTPGGPAGQPERAWHLVVCDLEGEAPLDGRFALRSGVFVELAGDAE